MVYPPGEDSILLKKWLKKQRLGNKKVLDMGTGTGILAVTAAEKGAETIAADKDPEAIKAARQKAGEHSVQEQIKFIQTDLFNSIEDSFDLIIFNPPYLPGRKIDEEDKTWRGGQKGVETTKEFLKHAENHLKPGGETVTIVSSLSEHEQLMENFELEIVESEKLWFEQLYLAKLVF